MTELGMYIPWGIISIILSALSFFIRDLIMKIKVLELDLQNEKIKIAVINSKVDDLRVDIKDIKANVQKLVERR